MAVTRQTRPKPGFLDKVLTRLNRLDRDGLESLVKRLQTERALLETKLTELGATVETGPNFTENVVVDGRLVTGQNPQSAAGVAREVLSVLN